MQTLPDTDTLYRALENRDSSLEGIFFFGVKTTGIFCRPGCSARTPKKQNVDYFSRVQDALDYGYRPCKRCQPLLPAGRAPEWVGSLLKNVESNPEQSFKDEDLRDLDIDPARIRRWFQKHHGMTFHAYVKALRINRAFEKMKSNNSVTRTAFDSGYESISGFHEAFKNLTGFSPSESVQRSIVTVTLFSSPLGPIYLAATDRGLCFLEFSDRKMIDDQINKLQASMKARFVKGRNALLETVEKQLQEYFSACRREFDFPLDLKGTEFQLQAWRALQQIPYGETWSYQQQADYIGKPNAARAVASANAKNHIAIVIPCHRVIARSGGLAGFGGGIWRKKFLLELESEREPLAGVAG